MKVGNGNFTKKFFLKIELLKVCFEILSKKFLNLCRKMLGHQILMKDLGVEIIPHGSKAGRLNDWVKTGVGALAGARSLNKISHKSANSPWKGDGNIWIFLFFLQQVGLQFRSGACGSDFCPNFFGQGSLLNFNPWIAFPFFKFKIFRFNFIS